jgi:hypothetical protein
MAGGGQLTVDLGRDDHLGPGTGSLGGGEGLREYAEDLGDLTKQSHFSGREAFRKRVSTRLPLARTLDRPPALRGGDPMHPPTGASA